MVGGCVAPDLQPPGLIGVVIVVVGLWSPGALVGGRGAPPVCRGRSLVVRLGGAASPVRLLCAL
jgi:hypothetical protein